jgi:hypothetical protein
VVADFGDDVPLAVFCIPDDPPPVDEEQAGLVFSAPSNSGLIGAI